MSAKIVKNLLSSRRPLSHPERDLWIEVTFQALRNVSRLPLLDIADKFEWIASETPTKELLKLVVQLNVVELGNLKNVYD